MLITRKIINPKIKFIDIKPKIKFHNYSQLCQKIDHIKDILVEKYDCRPGQSVLIGITSSTLQIAAFFACAELGLEVIILDHGRDDNWISTDYIDPKTQALMPINFYINDDPQHLPEHALSRHKFFDKISDHTVILDNITHGIERPSNDTIFAEPKRVLLKCTSSGTTGTAKLVKHSHEFLHLLANRNKNFYSDTVCMVMNLNHGSSPATYFLPALVSEKTRYFISSKMYRTIKNINLSMANNSWDLTDLSETVHNYNINHLMLPYTHLIDDFFDKGKYPDLNLYTLSTIRQEWLEYYHGGGIKNIISFFGCNETSGPLLINEINDANFSESKYKLYDNFYGINLQDGKNLEVDMPVYKTKILTNDVFEPVEGYFLHKGRNDLYRINGRPVNLFKYNDIVSARLDATLIIDTMKDSIYLAIWKIDDKSEEKIRQIDDQLLGTSEGLHRINKFASLERDKFYSGVKLDMELLRDYFRKFV